MPSIILNCPVNVRRSFSEMLKEFSSELGRKNGITIEVKVQQRPDDPLLQKAIDAGEIPDIIIAHAAKLVDLGQEKIEEYFQPLPGLLSMRREMTEIGFADPAGYLNSYALVPFVIIYNRNLIEARELPQTWEELISEKWWGKIAAPFAHHAVSRLVLDYIKYYFAEQHDGFEQNTYFANSPQEIVIAVDEGRFPLGIMNISFAKFSRNKNVGFIWPQEGALCSPQVVAFKKDVDKSLLAVADFLMSNQMQEFFYNQDFMPSSQEIPIPPELTKNQYGFWWDGWEQYFKILRQG